MNDQQIDEIAQDTAEDILKCHAPDCLQRVGLRDAIARLARLGLQSSFRLYLLQHRHDPEEIPYRQSTPGGGHPAPNVGARFLRAFAAGILPAAVAAFQFSGLSKPRHP